MYCLQISKALPCFSSSALASIAQRIDYKLSYFCFSVINGTGPDNLFELLTIYTPSQQLHSASDTRLF